MNTKKHNWILYLISATIIATVAIQFYWNYKNYEQNKQRVINEIQISLDNSIEIYYADLSKQNFFAIVEESTTKLDNKKDTVSFQITSLSLDIDHVNQKKEESLLIDSIFKNAEKSFKLKYHDSVPKEYSNTRKITQFSKDGKRGITMNRSGDISKVKVFKGRKANDSLKLINSLNTIWISLQNDTINYKEVDSIFTEELKNKGITARYSFKHFKNDSLFFDNSDNKQKAFLKAEAKSTYFKPNEKFLLNYSNPTYEALKRSSTGILLSLLLSLAVITSLFYLLKIINKQKELAEIKNDLISNITHEFKTPITTVSTAIEAIDNFNMIDDKEKTKKYLSISTIQLKKLHQMVEKLLETATLDSEKLMLKKESVDLIGFVDKIVQKHQLITPEKKIQFSTNISEITTEIDTFHFENSISNLIDNAIKYGGDNIQVNINAVLNTLEISVADNGVGIDKNQQEKIFDKFYRVPKGNTHDVKGFGIGLYYTKKIIEKHNGFISLTSIPKQTVFKITLPND
ncbi:HAMP domain-containing histidine kinase [Tenacibaculum sp. S7007]|uniref:histidine kinase n=1 Tax=Tenacibaculum pelagium TaxID=2759527 RepID=A0A839AMX7_9FLAO|nr:HAMP domain-containing sensor histidine kinase [Tenacibaculum pelagium]MBA6155836.1 HAMP domain-containing histidine kinase [Tenacibaculum pelagium]